MASGHEKTKQGPYHQPIARDSVVSTTQVAGDYKRIPSLSYLGPDHIDAAPLLTTVEDCPPPYQFVPPWRLVTDASQISQHGCLEGVLPSFNGTLPEHVRELAYFDFILFPADGECYTDCGSSIVSCFADHLCSGCESSETSSYQSSVDLSTSLSDAGKTLLVGDTPRRSQQVASKSDLNVAKWLCKLDAAVPEEVFDEKILRENRASTDGENREPAKSTKG